jgi:hypothetical protein
MVVKYQGTATPMDGRSTGRDMDVKTGTYYYPVTANFQ